jgi:hypothetical protein
MSTNSRFGVRNLVGSSQYTYFNKKNNKNNKVKSKPLELYELAGKNQQQKKVFHFSTFEVGDSKPPPHNGCKTV